MTPPPFFIVGCDRSGTTMLRLILDGSPDVAIPTESMILVDFAGQAGAALATDAEFDRLAYAVWRHPKVREWGLPGDPPLREGRTGPAAYRAALEAPFLAYAELHGKPRWADKTPYYVGEIDQVKRVFPEARIVNLVRDGRDVALSLLRVPFGPGNVWAAARQWRAAVDAGDTADARYGGDVLTIRYEDLVAEPDAVARQVCAFCEIAYRPEMLAIEDSAAGKLASGQEGWFTELFAGIGTRSVGKWRTGMTRRPAGRVRGRRVRGASPARLRGARRRRAAARPGGCVRRAQLGGQGLELRPPARLAGARPRGAARDPAAAAAAQR